jgi:hypothetical protein
MKGSGRAECKHNHGAFTFNEADGKCSCCSNSDPYLNTTQTDSTKIYSLCGNGGVQGNCDTEYTLIQEYTILGSEIFSLDLSSNGSITKFNTISEKIKECTK